MTNLNWFASLVFATTTITALGAETRCPGNVVSLPFRLVNRHQMIVAVSINRSGPYDFLLDTGTEFTIVDIALANELHLNQKVTAAVEGAGFRVAASLSRLDQIEAGSDGLTNQEVFVFDLHSLKAANLDVRGVLGEDFLGHFDLLIDNVHSQLCIDDTATMRAAITGEHIPLLDPGNTPSGLSPSKAVIVSARLSDASRPVRLELDSGANGAILYNTCEYLARTREGHLLGTGIAGSRMIFSPLPLQDVTIGSLRLTGVRFYSPDCNLTDSHAKGFDGILSLGLFRRVFISRSDHFAVLEPEQ